MEACDTVIICFILLNGTSQVPIPKVHMNSCYYRPQTKLQKGNIFTLVCQSAPGQTPLRYTHSPSGRHPQQMATPVDGTHPTGMHSCLANYFPTTA